MKTDNHTTAFLALPEEEQKRLKQQLPRTETIQTQSVYSSSFSEVIKEAKEFAEKWNKTLDDVSLERYVDHGYYGDTSATVQFEVNGLETDEQWHRRLIEENDRIKCREAYERKEFERLKAKFDK